MLHRRYRTRSLDPQNRPRPDLPRGTHVIQEISHVVILMMSGHSYDNYFGTLEHGDGLHSLGSPAPIPPVNLCPPVASHHLATTVQKSRQDVLGDWTASHIRFTAGKTPGGNVLAGDGFQETAVARGLEKTDPFGYWTEQDLPFYHNLARIFPLADRWFSSCLGSGKPNRRYLVSGTAFGSAGDIRLENNRPPRSGTVFDLLDHHNISWANYFHDSSNLHAIAAGSSKTCPKNYLSGLGDICD
jgi:phospholipase C